jgi:pimeloyl-ACP methyl ester carboxylesterase
VATGLAREHLQVEANGVAFHVVCSGPHDGVPVVCLHGFPEGSVSWGPVMERLTTARVHAPDLRGYPGSGRPPHGYDVLTLTDDVAALIGALGLDRPVLVGHDWGGALAWIFAHRRPDLIRRLVVVNCPHPRTLVRAILRCEDWQTFRVPWVPLFQIPWLPEALLTTAAGRAVLRLSFILREGRQGAMNRALVDELVARFRRPVDLGRPIDYYRQMVRTQLDGERRRRLTAAYDVPIPVPVTLVWGEKDGALSAKVARQSDRDAGCPVEWRPLPGVGHFVGLEAPDELARELERLLEPSRR